MKKLMLVVALGSCLQAATQTTPTPVTIQLQTFATGLSGPVDLAHAGDDRLFAVEQDGVIKIIDAAGTVLPTPFLDIDPRVNSSGNEQGLLGLAFHPEFPDSNYFYVNYTANGGGATTISRFTVTSDPNVADPNSELIIYSAFQFASNHNGGDLDFGPDGYLYIPTGDGGSGNDPGNRAQTMSNQMGKMMRIDVDGGPLYTVPADNPYAGTAFPQDTLPEIWAVGLRNPYRFGFDALTGDVWIGDVGQNAWEEVDFWPAGDNSGPNFGWRCYEGNHNAVTTGCLPLSSYVGPASEHQQTQQGWCSVIGGRVYRGAEYPRLFGRYIYTDYCGGQFYTLHPDGAGGWEKEQVLATGQFGFTAIAENSDLDMFAVRQNGTIFKIVDPCPDDFPVIAFDGTDLMSTAATSYLWFLNGNAIGTATTQTYTPIANGTYYVIAQTSTGCYLQSDTLSVLVTGIEGVSGNAISIHPVPAQDMLTITWSTPLNNGSVNMLDLSGRSVLQQQWNNSSASTRLDVSQLAEGTYMIQLVDATGVPLATAQTVISR